MKIGKQMHGEQRERDRDRDRWISLISGMFLDFVFYSTYYEICILIFCNLF